MAWDDLVERKVQIRAAVLPATCAVVVTHAAQLARVQVFVAVMVPGFGARTLACFVTVHRKDGGVDQKVELLSKYRSTAVEQSQKGSICFEMNIPFVMSMD